MAPPPDFALGAAMTDPAANPGQVADEGPARQNEIAETLRRLRKLVIFSGDELTEGLPLYFNSVSLLEELEARVEDARLFLQGQERTAGSSGQRQWLARGVSPERAFEMRAARATSWNEFTQAEVDAMTPSMRHAMTTRLATQAAAAAKAKARAEAEEIAKEVSPAARRRSTTLRSLRPLWKTSRSKPLRKSWRCLPLSRRTQTPNSSATSSS